MADQAHDRLSDGERSAPSYAELAERMRGEGVTDLRRGRGRPRHAGKRGHGQDRRCRRRQVLLGEAIPEPKAMPRIFQKEARRVARPLMYEDKGGIAVEQQFPSTKC